MNDSKLLILVNKVTNRLLYTFNYVLTNRLGASFELTSDKDAFIGSQNDAKLNYSSHKVDGVLHVIPSSILYEKKIYEVDLGIELENKLPLIFANGTQSLRHDVFGAVFYMLSRYQEYLPNRYDEYGRFSSAQSVLARYDALQIAVVDRYINRFAIWLNEHVKTLSLAPRKEQGSKLFTLDVDQLYMFKSKGLARTCLAAIKDLLVNRKQLSKRLNVIIGKDQDPIDIYDELIEKCKEKNIPSVLFFQVGEPSRFDINNPSHLPNVKSRINELSLRTEIGIHPSYFSSERERVLGREFDRFNELTSSSLNKSRQHYLRFKIPQTFRQLESLGVQQEYSMAFADCNGFRAGTCFSFPFFDLEKDEKTRIEIVPTHFLDITSVRNSGSLEKSKDELNQLYLECKKVGGRFVAVFHPEVLCGYDVDYPSLDLFDHFIKS